MSGMLDSDSDIGGDEKDEPDSDIDEDEFAGDFIVCFGKYSGKPLRLCGKDWISFCLSKSWSDFRPDFREAATVYMRYLKEHPGKCVIEFGKKHRDCLTEDCRDLPWIEWCTRQPALLRRYPQWCEAATHWLNIRPIRHYGVIRDIGERTDIDDWRADLEQTVEDEYELDDFVVADPESGEEDGEEGEDEDDDASMTAQSTEEGERSSDECLEEYDEPMENPSDSEVSESLPARRHDPRARIARQRAMLSSEEDPAEPGDAQESDQSVSSQSVSEKGAPHRPQTRSQTSARRCRAISHTEDAKRSTVGRSSELEMPSSGSERDVSHRPHTRSQMIGQAARSRPARVDASNDKVDEHPRSPRTPPRLGLPTPRLSIRRLPRTPPRVLEDSNDDDTGPSTPQAPARPFPQRPRFVVPDSEGEDDPKHLLGASSQATPPSPRGASPVLLTPDATDDDMDDTPVQHPGRRPGP